MSRNWPVRARLSLETLEPRTLLAGNVSVSLVGDNLVIKGDQQGNKFSVAESADDTFTVASLDGTTKFNRGQDGPIVVAGVTGGVFVKTSGGEDEIRVLSGTSIRGGLEIRAGFDADRVLLEGTADSPITVGRDLTIHASIGADQVQADHLSVGGNAMIDTSDGVDQVLLGGTSSVMGNLTLRLGRDNDELALGNGTDPWTIGGSLSVHASLGDDHVALKRVTVTGKTAIDTSDGRDCVELRDSSFSDLEVKLGHHTDDLLIAGTKVSGTARLRGSAGSDTFFDGGGNTSDGTTPRDLKGSLDKFEQKDGDPAEFCK